MKTKSFSIQSNAKEVVIRLDKTAIPTEMLLKIANRLQVEYLAQQAGFTGSLLDIAEEIDEVWWEKNGATFLQAVKK